MTRFVLFSLLALGLVACSSSGTRMPVATLTFVPFTATPSEVAVQPTQPPTSVVTLLEPDQINVSATVAPLEPLIASDVTIDRAFVQQMVDDLMVQTGVDAQLVQWVSVDTARWQKARLGCDFGTATPPATSIDGYRVVFLVGNVVYEYHTDATTTFRRCNTTERAHGELLILIDPVASELVAIAKRQTAQTLDLPIKRIQLVDVVAYTWTDTSLGCPMPKQTYSTTIVDGYRIVLQVGDTQTIFHTDSERLYACEGEREQLP